jgi:hypothetical protein
MKSRYSHSLLLLLAVATLGMAQPPAFDKVMITEVCAYGAEAVELANFGATTADLSGYVLKWRFSGTTYTSAPLSVALAPREIMVVRDADGGGPDLHIPAHVGVYPVLPAMTVPVGALVGVALFNGAGALVDEVFLGGPIVLFPIFETSIGGTFRGLAQADQGPDGTYATERIWGLDSDGGRDWVRSPHPTIGRENNSVGLRGSDLGGDRVVINEVDTRQTGPGNHYHTVELQNRSLTPVDLRNWFLLASGRQGGPLVRITPWSNSTPVAAGAYVVLMSSTLIGLPPAEMPAGTPLFVLGTSTGMLPFTGGDEYTLALYDHLGRLVDMVRANARGTEVAHNHPRPPSAWDDFRGSARRPAGAGVGIGRITAAFDSDTAADWFPTQSRTMGTSNFYIADGSAPDQNVPDVRLHDGEGLGLTLIVNGGGALAGRDFYLLLSSVRSNGTGPILGLGLDALANFATYALGGYEPFHAVLGTEGTYRYEIPPFSLPAGIRTDNIGVVLSPSLPGGATRTNVLEFDT